MCKTDGKDKGMCRKRNIVYKVECTRCKLEGKSSTYWGETARNGQLRGGEHVKDLEKQREGSHMLRHLLDAHQGKGVGDPADLSFKMSIHKKYRSPLERQLGEAINIANAGGPGAEGVLNQKEEYSRCVVPELQVSEGWRDTRKQKRCREQGPTSQDPPSKRPRRACEQGITATRHPRGTEGPTQAGNRAEEDHLRKPPPSPQQETQERQPDTDQPPPGREGEGKAQEQQEQPQQHPQVTGITATRHPSASEPTHTEGEQPTTQHHQVKTQDRTPTSTANQHKATQNRLPVDEKSVKKVKRTTSKTTKSTHTVSKTHTQPKITTILGSMKKKEFETKNKPPEEPKKIENQGDEKPEEQGKIGEQRTREEKLEKETHRQTDKPIPRSAKLKGSKLRSTNKNIHSKANLKLSSESKTNRIDSYFHRDKGAAATSARGLPSNNKLNNLTCLKGPKGEDVTTGDTRPGDLTKGDDSTNVINLDLVPLMRDT